LKIRRSEFHPVWMPPGARPIRYSWKLPIAASAVVGVACAGGFAVLWQEPSATATAQAPAPQQAVSSAEEPPATGVRNTGRPPGPAFLADLRQGYDSRTQYLGDYDMNADWIKIAFKPRNVRFDETGMTLELVKTTGRLPFSGGEFQRTGWYGYGRYEVVMAASEDHGAISSFFIHTGAYHDDPHDEINFEFVGRSPRQLHLTYFRHGAEDSVNIPLWFDTAQADHLYAFEWAPNLIRWYVDGVKVHEVHTATAKIPIPTTSARVIANIWTGAGDTAEWTGAARFAHTSARYSCISHVPLGGSGPQCSDRFKPPPRPPEAAP
jgi:endo-1,3-1,4-beta-glycanase ExoK